MSGALTGIVMLGETEQEHYGRVLQVLYEAPTHITDKDLVVVVIRFGGDQCSALMKKIIGKPCLIRRRMLNLHTPTAQQGLDMCDFVLDRGYVVGDLRRVGISVVVLRCSTQ